VTLAAKGQVTLMMTVATVMTAPALAVPSSMPLQEVARLLADRRISGVPVVDDAGTVLGVVSEVDFLMKEQGPDAIRHRRLSSIRGESSETNAQIAKMHATTAGEAMTAPAIAISSTRPLSEAARLMTSNRISRLPVVDDGVLVGVITRADLVRAFVRTDKELDRVVREDVLRNVLCLNPMAFDVTVDEGRVRIVGHVERRSMVELVERAIAMVPGVVTITADLTWAADDINATGAPGDGIFPLGIH
jgi:CBS domain-containing protein